MPPRKATTRRTGSATKTSSSSSKAKTAASSKSNTAAAQNTSPTRGGELAAMKGSLNPKIQSAIASSSSTAERHAKPLRTFINGGSVTCLSVNQVKGDLLVASTAHGDLAVVATEVADQVLAEEAGGNAEQIATSSILRNAHRKKITCMTCDNKGNFVTGSGDGSLKIWAVDPSASLFPVCIKTLFPQDYAVELEKPYVPPRQKKFEVPEVTDVVVVDGGKDRRQNNSNHQSGGGGENNEEFDEENELSNNINNNSASPTVIYASYSDGLLRKWDAGKEHCVQIIRPSFGRITSLAMMQGTPSYLLACGNDSGVVSVFSGDSSITSPSAQLSEEAMQMTWPEPIRSVAMVNCFVPPTTLKNPSPPPITICFCASASGTIYGFNLATGEKKTALKHFGCGGTGEGSSAVVKLLQGPNCLLSAHDNGSVILWNILDWSAAGTFWHSAVEGKTSVLSTATLFAMNAVSDSSFHDEDESPQQQQQQQSSTSFNNRSGVGFASSPVGARSFRPGSAPSIPEAPSVPSSKIALVTSTMTGSVSVWTNCIIDAIEKLRMVEKSISDEVLEKLKAKRAEEKANKRRGLG